MFSSYADVVHIQEEIALTVLPLVLNAVICEATFPDSKALSICFGSYLVIFS